MERFNDCRDSKLAYNVSLLPINSFDDTFHDNILNSIINGSYEYSNNFLPIDEFLNVKQQLSFDPKTINQFERWSKFLQQYRQRIYEELDDLKDNPNIQLIIQDKYERIFERFNADIKKHKLISMVAEDAPPAIDLQKILLDPKYQQEIIDKNLELIKLYKE